MFLAKKKIVVIEDEIDLSTTLQEILTDNGYVVLVAGNAEDGQKLIETEKPDLVLLDTILPGMSGIELLEKLVPFRTENPTPVLMLSNLDNPEDLKKAREYGVEEYLVKTDWRLEDVIRKIKKAL